MNESTYTFRAYNSEKNNIVAFCNVLLPFDLLIKNIMIIDSPYKGVLEAKMPNRGAKAKNGKYYENRSVEWAKESHQVAFEKEIIAQFKAWTIEQMEGKQVPVGHL